MNFGELSKIKGIHIHDFIRLGALVYSSIIYMLLSILFDSRESLLNSIKSIIMELSTVFNMLDSDLIKYFFALIFAFTSAAFYGIYKAIIYQHLIMPMQDKLRNGKNNYRTYFRKKFSIGTVDAQDFYIHLRDKYLAEGYKLLVIKASYIHGLYQSSMCGLAFSGYYLYLENMTLFFLYVLLSVLLALTGFIHDKKLEHTELITLLKIREEVISKEFEEYSKLGYF